MIVAVAIFGLKRAAGLVRKRLQPLMSLEDYLEPPRGNLRLRATISRQDQSSPLLQNPPIWDNPEVRQAAKVLEARLAQATAKISKHTVKGRFQVARAWIRLSYWITLALLFALAILIRILS